MHVLVVYIIDTIIKCVRILDVPEALLGRQPAPAVVE